MSDAAMREALRRGDTQAAQAWALRMGALARCPEVGSKCTVVYDASRAGCPSCARGGLRQALSEGTAAVAEVRYQLIYDALLEALACAVKPTAPLAPRWALLDRLKLEGCNVDGLGAAVYMEPGELAEHAMRALASRWHDCPYCLVRATVRCVDAIGGAA